MLEHCNCFCFLGFLSLATQRHYHKPCMVGSGGGVVEAPPTSTGMGTDRVW